jgi:FAD/FMN-containing dehydrogenase/Fe-S oxidoreductase
MTLSANARSALAGQFEFAIQGDVLFDDYSRAQYAVDASPYETFPAAVVLPRTQDDLLETIRIAWDAGVPVIARGGGTGRLGQAVGEGVVVDFSKYLTRFLYYDASARTCIVEPGITPQALNKALRPERVWFPVDIASAAQATIGGMLATDAIGSRALLYGRMRDNISACDAVLAHGADISFQEISQNFGLENAPGEDGSLILDLLEIAQNHQDIIRTLRELKGAQLGYNVQTLAAGYPSQNLAAFLAGSEGTLAVVKRMELKLVRRPLGRALGVCYFPLLSCALRAVAQIVALQPSDIELSSRHILELASAIPENKDVGRRLMRDSAEVMLIVEFMEGNRVKNARKLKDLSELMAQLGHPRAVSEHLGSAAQEAVKRVHGDGLSRLYAKTPASMAFVAIKDIALPLQDLPSMAEAIDGIFLRHGMNAVWHGQVGVGAIYVRPWLFRNSEPDQISAVARNLQDRLEEFTGGYNTVEGYGTARSFPIENLRDRKMTRLFEEIKSRFDPQNRLNPGKIVGSVKPVPEMMRARPENGTAYGLSALNCGGTAICRALDKDVMCPSFKVTRNESDSPRGRANAFRLALAGQLGPDPLASDDMAKTMALCVSCKACRSECPRAVDITQARIAVQSDRAQKFGLTKFEWTAAHLPHYAPRMRSWRHILNLRDYLPWTASFSERLTGISAVRPWPRWSGNPFPAGRIGNGKGGMEILLFPDTFNNYFDPVTLRSAADVLSASGFRLNLLLPPRGERPYCCGRTFFEMGLVDQARLEARRLIAAAAPFIERNIPLVGLEPACILTMRDEFLNVLNENGAQSLASASLLFEEVMSQPSLGEAIKPKLFDIEADVLFKPHCHQYAFKTAKSAQWVAAMVPGINVIETETSCCGMGTLFGYHQENVSTSFQMGENALFPQIRRASRDTLLIADGFACRKQINDGTGRTVRHTAVLLKLSLAAKEKLGHDVVINGARFKKRFFRLRRHYFR